MSFPLSETPVHPPSGLKVAANGRHLSQADGKPFFWLADTAWELFHRLDREEAETYLRVRAAQGFSVVLAVVLAELDGLRTPNAYGQCPLQNGDPSSPNEAYFEHVDFVVRRAAAHGLVVGLLPTWGDKWNKLWGVGPEVFSPANARVFGEFLGRRYRDDPIVWVLGGDRNPRNETDLALVRAMAGGLRDGDGGRHLMTYHPQGGSCSAEFFPDESWLDFHMFQSGHGPAIDPNYRATLQYREHLPVKPVVDGEPLYEDHPINWQPANGWFDDFASRRTGYWSMLSGAMGHTFGNHNVWQMWQPGRDPVTHARTPWQEAIHWPGAGQAGIFRRFFESIDWVCLVPAHELVTDAPNAAGRAVLAARTETGDCTVVYSPYGSAFGLNPGIVSGDPARAHWVNPRDGSRIPVTRPPGLVWKPPGDEGRGNDWVLVISEGV